MRQDGLHYDSVNVIKRIIWILLITSTILEVCFFPTTENAVGCLTFIYAWMLVDNFVFKRKYLLSSLCLPVIAVVGLAFMYFFLPLPITLIEAKPLTFNFELPYITWINQMLFITSVVIAFQICRIIYRPNCWLNSLWRRMGYFQRPTESQIWLLGFLGLGALLLQISIQGEGSEETVRNMGFLIQFVGFFKSFAFFPVLLMIPDYQSTTRNNSTFIFKREVVFYMVLLLLIGVATTKRTIMFQPIIILVVSYVLLMILKNKIHLSVKRTFLAIIGVYIVTGPISDIAMAMILNRATSYHQSASETFNDVLDLYNDKEKLHYLFQSRLTEYDNQGKNEEGWSEYYVDNILLDRFCNVRVVDATIYHAQNLGFGKSMMMKDYTKDFFINLMPSFMLGSVKKNYDITSPGDILSSESLRRHTLYRGFRVAGDTGVGLSLWGYSFYIINTLVIAVYFYFLASMLKINNNGNIVIPIHVLASLMTYFMVFGNSMGIFKYFQFMLRDGWEAILVYCIVFHLIRKVL